MQKAAKAEAAAKVGSALDANIDSLKAVIKKLIVKDDNGKSGFKKAFMKLDRQDKKEWDPQRCSAGLRYPEHNRYNDIMPWDKYRVKLNDPAQDLDAIAEGDYVNASTVYNLLPGAPKFIAAQGPKKATVVTFWKMVQQQRSPVIIMVTNLKEGKKIKCWRYWPGVGKSIEFPADDHGPQVHVVLESEQNKGTWVERRFKLTSFNPDLGCMDELNVLQLHYTDWPDRGVPESSGAFLGYLNAAMSAQAAAVANAVKEEGDEQEPPMVVHCSAGVGRTGVFCTVYAALTYLPYIGKDGHGPIDIHATIVKARTMRRYMVQTMDQYRFVHLAILQGMKLYRSGTAKAAAAAEAGKITATTPAVGEDAKTESAQTSAATPVSVAPAEPKQAEPVAALAADCGDGFTVDCIGKPVTVAGYGRGTLRFVGFEPNGTPCCGVELDEVKGKHAGTVDGRIYFTCAEGHGILVHPNACILVPPLEETQEASLSPDAAKDTAGSSKDKVHLRKKSLRARLGKGLKKRFSHRHSHGPPPDAIAAADAAEKAHPELAPDASQLSKRDVSEFEAPPMEVVESVFMHGGRLLTLLGRSPSATWPFINANYQQLKEPCSDRPAFKMQRPIGAAHGALAGLYAYVYFHSNAWVLAIMGAGVVAVLDGDFPLPDHSGWYVTSSSEHLVIDPLLRASVSDMPAAPAAAKATPKRRQSSAALVAQAAAAASGSGSKGSAVEETLRVELEVSRANERRFRKELEEERARKASKDDKGGDDGAASRLAALEKELTRLADTERDLADVLSVVGELETHIKKLESQEEKLAREVEALAVAGAAKDERISELEVQLASGSSSAAAAATVEATKPKPAPRVLEFNPFGAAPPSSPAAAANPFGTAESSTPSKTLAETPAEEEEEC